jgi:hypothetical protein
MKSKYIVSMLAVLIGSFSASAAETFDLQGLIDRQISAGEKEITVPPGRYCVAPKNKAHLKFSGISDVTIIADGVEMICTQTTRALTVENCTNLTIRGLTIDYDPLPFTQGRIVGMSADSMVHEIELSDGYPRADKADDLKYAIFADSRTLRYGNYYTFTLEAPAPNRIRLTKSGQDKSKKGGEQVGDLIVLAARHVTGGAEPHAVYCDNSKNTVLENITLYASPTFGFLEVHCDGSVYRNCKVDRRPPETDLIKREPRLRSLNADAYHSKFAKKGPQIIGCSAEWQGDDCVNICGSYHLVTEANGDTLRVLAKRDMDIEPGDPVELVTVDGQRIPDAKVLSVIRSGKASAEESAGLKKLPLLARVRGLLTDGYEVKLDRSVEMPFGSTIGSMNRMGNDFAVKNCIFGNNRSRGILAKASFGEISGNTLTNCSMQAIKIAPEYQWLESGHSSGMVISNNTIINPGMEAIFIHALGNHPAHEEIKVSGNTIYSDFSPAVYIGGLKNGTMQANQIKRTDGGGIDKPVVLEYSTGMKVDR